MSRAADRIFFFFFSSRRRHTRSYGDWGSDVCSSDLVADTASQACRGQAQQFIAGVVPEVVVDCFKTIEVNHENGKHLSTALGTGERLFQAVLGDITVRDRKSGV